MEVRTLRAGEREALLALLDGWDVGDGWRGRDFFRRYLERDTSFRDENVWVAEEGGSLVSCVQIFPRRLRVAGAAAPAGGVGSVFTRADRRGRGVGARVLARALEAMDAAGMEVALLFAGPVAWYEGQGWSPWRRPRILIERGASEPVAPPPGVEIAPFEAGRDLAEAAALHERFDADRDGTVLRDTEGWQTSLRVAGNPDEEFLVVRRRGVLAAYVRAVVLNRFFLLSEFACEPDAESLLAEAIVRLLAARADDPLARRAGAPADVRARALAGTPSRDAALRAGLEARGMATREVEDPTAVLRCLDACALARRAGTSTEPGETPARLLARLLPPERLAFWPSDRF